jgi:hypothetical protein
MRREREKGDAMEKGEPEAEATLAQSAERAVA